MPRRQRARPRRGAGLHYAREFYGRRQESVRLWVVPRDGDHGLTDPDLLQPPLDRSFKRPGGYVIATSSKRPKREPGRHHDGGRRLPSGS